MSKSDYQKFDDLENKIENLKKTSSSLRALGGMAPEAAQMAEGFATQLKTLRDLTSAKKIPETWLDTLLTSAFDFDTSLLIKMILLKNIEKSKLDKSQGRSHKSYLVPSIKSTSEFLSKTPDLPFDFSQIFSKLGVLKQRKFDLQSLLVNYSETHSNTISEMEEVFSAMMSFLDLVSKKIESIENICSDSSSYISMLNIKIDQLNKMVDFYRTNVKTLNADLDSFKNHTGFIKRTT